MRGVAIIGAGEIGGALAQALAARDIARTIHMIDEAGRVAEGKALDIMQSSPITGFGTQVFGTTDLTTAADAAVIVVTDRVAGGEWQGDEGLLVLKRLLYFARDGVVVCAGAAQRELVERGYREVRFARERLFGSAPEALAAALQAIVALEINGSPGDVALTVLGVPPLETVVPWEDATIGGLAATRVLDEPARRRMAARVNPLWPPGPHALAHAAAKSVAGVLGHSRHTVAAFVAPDDTHGRRTRAAALPVRVGQGGIEAVDMPRLSTRDRVALENAMLL
jgi:malate dehydrogenase